MKKQKIGPMYILIGACASGLYIASAGLGNCLGLFYRSLAAAIGSGIGSVSLCITMCAVVTGFAAKLMPVILKRFPFKLIILAGTGMLVGGTFVSSFATAFPMLLVCFLVKGLGGCLIGMTSINYVVDNWFYEGSGTVLGVGMSMSGVVAALLSPWFSSMIEANGWQFSLRTLSMVSLLFCLPMLLLGKTRPEDRGMIPYGEAAQKKSKQAPGEADLPVVKDYTYYAILVIMFLITAAFCMVNHVATYASSIGLTPAVGALLVSTTMIGNMVFKLLIGYFCDRINPLRTSIIAFSFVALSFLLFIVGTHVVWINFVAAACLGSVFGCSTIAVGQIIKMVYDRALFSRIYTTTLMVSSLASASFGILTGYSFDWFGTYLPALSVYFVTTVITVILLISIERKTA